MSKSTLLLLLFLPSLLLAQKSEHKKNHLSPTFQLDTYYSFIGNKGADVWGFRAGVSLNNEWKFTAGYNKIKADIIEYKTLPQSELPYSTHPVVKAQLYLKYYPLSAEYVFFSKDPWQLSVPVSIGYGRSYFEYFDSKNAPRDIFKHGVLVNYDGISAQYKVVKWVGLGAGLGYRVMLVNNPNISTNFNSPVFSFQIKIFLNEVVHSLFPNGLMNKNENLETQ
jgi:hypothetical protein